MKTNEKRPSPSIRIFAFGFFLATTLCLAGAVCGVEDDLRTWQDRTGQFQIRARLVRVDGGKVVLHTQQGRQIEVKLEQLSARDRLFVREQTTTTKAPDRNPDVSTPKGPGVTAAELIARPSRLKYENARTFRVRIGARIESDGVFNNVICTFPIPLAWPEQKVTEVTRDVSDNVSRMTSRTLDNGVEQFEFRVKSLRAGQAAHVIIDFDVERFQIVGPTETVHLQIPKRSTAMKKFYGESPFIEITNSDVRDAAKTIPLSDAQTAWEKVETIYDWSRERVKHNGTKPLKGALEALRSGIGDCEERTSLFVAMCRLHDIPARSVWVERHTYPEFYLVDTEGKGHWFPCESLGTRSFGSMPSYRLILQKGDNFKMSQKPSPQRYVTATLSGSLGRGAAQPTLREIREYPQP